MKATLDGKDLCVLLMAEPTEKGTPAFSFYATADQYAELRPVFLQIALSVTPDPEIAYRTEATTNNDTETQKAATDKEALNSLKSLIRVGLMIACWLLPGIIASKRNHPKKIPIWYLTAFLGWTGIGWIPAIIWACQFAIARPCSVSCPSGVIRPARTRPLKT